VITNVKRVIGRSQEIVLILQYSEKWRQKLKRDQRWTWTGPLLLDRTVRDVVI
jgi:hypothetical protein